MDLTKIIQEKKGTVVDVRTMEEFQGGHVGGSINIPLQQLANRMDEVRALTTPLILCCASGGRSGMAQQSLSGQGIECFNAGSWTDVNYIQTLNS